MTRLNNRNMQIPGGFRFYQPETKWFSATAVGSFPSFDRLVTAVVQHRNGNPALVAKYNWNTDPGTVAEEVDAFNAAVCAQMGWAKYITVGGDIAPLPKSQPLQQIDQKQVSAVAAKVRKIWAGVKTLNDWLDSGEDPVSAMQAEDRATCCSACPKNQKGDFTTWFTAPAAAAIKRQLERLNDRKIATNLDEQLNVCEACLCPLKLKVHTPIKYIAPHTPEAVLAELRTVPNCWIVKEIGG